MERARSGPCQAYAHLEGRSGYHGPIRWKR